MKLPQLIFLLAAIVYAKSAGEVSLTGFITETWCGSKGANKQHVEHARRTVASGLAQYALYDEATKKLYILEPQAAYDHYCEI